jgi:hypothetical protein
MANDGISVSIAWDLGARVAPAESFAQVAERVRGEIRVAQRNASLAQNSRRLRRAASQSGRHIARRATRDADGFDTVALMPYHNCASSGLGKPLPALS